MMQTTRALIDIEHLSAGYGDLTVLHDVSLHVDSGEFVTLIGANGAGKTTLLNVLSGLIRPTSGTAYVLDADVAKMAPFRIVANGLAHVPQGRELFPQMTVLENLELGAHANQGKHSLAELLDEVFQYFPKLAERRKQNAGTLSGGEQQMVAVGRALMARPRVLLLDEPSAGLAPIIVDTLADVMQGLNDAGLPILLVEQNAFLALDLADRAYVMETGVIVEEGSAQTLRDSDRVRRAYLGI